ncbi:BREX-2 system adenine-specific DNA-methyltransferase PglX [Tunturiibacter gelidoferens]|uniref:site-specific DNA-methyltransferase (adenine-specific) n=1 Tax=Tunturiibacter lichenicola TaxID=2051959 RepID=A0A7Y9NRM3_9BACT|nr:BREX-2 system adenine-specific DNA-methyltransferase PglX [Edaphobacter lichenicola]NYF54062.1 hypothetical protein [Edaphobacter lichenicola]
MIDEQKLRQGLQKLLEGTGTAIRERLSDEPALEAKLRERHAAAVQAARTEGSARGYTAFADDAITQAAVHWLLGCVFVRFLEDNGWLDERNSKVAWISGPAERLAIAKDRRTLFLRPDPGLTDRDYLLHVFAEVSKLPGVAGLFDLKHNPLYSLQPTAQGAARIVEFFQKVDPDTNELIYDFSDAAHGTRFLGDLYQNLSESARKRYALCQTPGFVIDFILDRTLTPALDAFGLEILRVIDPSCGSGHFLLEAFARLIRAWENKEPGTNMPALVQRALDAVYGVDLNPFAIEITRFRLLISALESSDIGRLKDAPNFKFNLAAGDSLLHGSRISGGGVQRGLLEDRMEHFYDTEDAEELKRILSQPYHVVVGNPPYINVRDSVLRDAYRNRFTTCHGKYQLGVPFTERFFDLTVRSDSRDDGPAGWMGMIVSNAFMKRAFGKKLIENFLRRLDLTHVIDTSGVYLPGHGTPTTILLARHQPPVSSTIRAVRGIRGETGVPDDPANAPVWREIADHVDESGFEGSRVSIADPTRLSFDAHPWAIGGGGAAELKEAMDEISEIRLGMLGDPGVQVLTLADDVMVRPVGNLGRIGLTEARIYVTGEDTRDWSISSQSELFVPGDKPPAQLWSFRTTLSNRMSFGESQLERGLRWWDYGMVVTSRLSPPLIAFGCVATQNHFVLENRRIAFNRHAPVIRIMAQSSDETGLELLGLLNSSAGCFWLKQVNYPKGGDHVGTEGARVRKLMWDVYYEFDSTKLKQFPIPEEKPTAITKLIQTEVDARSSLLPEKLCAETVPLREQLDSARDQAWQHLCRMISLQEELDWQCYRLYGFLEDDLTIAADQIPLLNLGERAFEIVLARSNEEPLWFERNCSTPMTAIPSHWPEAYRDLVERRIAVIETNRDIALVERPEYKRRWNLPSWRDMESAALKGWLLDRMEIQVIWREHKLVSCSQLRDALSLDREWISVADIYNGTPVEDLDGFVISLALPESVPFLPTLRHTESGLRKRTEWEEVWRLQREEDAGVTNLEIPAPPKYVAKDFKGGDIWRLRGGLDVPKERFILYPGFERDSDRTPVLGWAGWSHLEQARALAAYYQRMHMEEGWEMERLKPILAGLLDLREWLKQWHDDLDPETGLKLGTYFSEFAEAQCQELGFSVREVLAWQSAGTTTGRKKSMAQ